MSDAAAAPHPRCVFTGRCDGYVLADDARGAGGIGESAESAGLGWDAIFVPDDMYCDADEKEYCEVKSSLQRNQRDRGLRTASFARSTTQAKSAEDEDKYILATSTKRCERREPPSRFAIPPAPQPTPAHPDATRRRWRTTARWTIATADEGLLLERAPATAAATAAPAASWRAGAPSPRCGRRRRTQSRTARARCDHSRGSSQRRVESSALRPRGIIRENQSRTRSRGMVSLLFSEDGLSLSPMLEMT